jgi:hypothetical protein
MSMGKVQPKDPKQAWNALPFMFGFTAPWPTLLAIGELFGDGPPVSGYLFTKIAACIWGAAFLVVIVLPMLALIKESRTSRNANKAALDEAAAEQKRRVILPPHMGGEMQEGHVLVMSMKPLDTLSIQKVRSVPHTKTKAKIPTVKVNEWAASMANLGVLRGVGVTKNGTPTTKAN